MIRVTTNPELKQNIVEATPRTKKLVHFYRAVSMFSMPIRSTELGLRRRK